MLLKIHVAVLLTFAVGFILALQVIPERATVTFINEKFIDYGKLSVSRYGRKSAYYFHIEGTIKHTWGNNVTVNLVFNEFLHNEYRRSFIEMHFKLCDMYHSDPYVGAMFNNVPCPMPPGEYHLMNLTMPSATINCPHLWPFERARADIELNTQSKEVLFTAQIFFRFLDKKKTGLAEKKSKVIA